MFSTVTPDETLYTTVFDERGKGVKRAVLEGNSTWKSRREAMMELSAGLDAESAVRLARGANDRLHARWLYPARLREISLSP